MLREQATSSWVFVTELLSSLVMLCCAAKSKEKATLLAMSLKQTAFLWRLFSCFKEKHFHRQCDVVSLCLLHLNNTLKSSHLCRRRRLNEFSLKELLYILFQLWINTTTLWMHDSKFHWLKNFTLIIKLLITSVNVKLLQFMFTINMYPFHYLSQHNQIYHTFFVFLFLGNINDDWTLISVITFNYTMNCRFLDIALS